MPNPNAHDPKQEVMPNATEDVSGGGASQRSDMTPAGREVSTSEADVADLSRDDPTRDRLAEWKRFAPKHLSLGWEQRVLYLNWVRKRRGYEGETAWEKHNRMKTVTAENARQMGRSITVEQPQPRSEGHE